MLVGHNDICGHACERVHFFNDPVKNASPSAYIFNVRTALDILHKQLPRTFVNLMAVAGEFSVSAVAVKSCRVYKRSKL